MRDRRLAVGIALVAVAAAAVVWLVASRGRSTQENAAGLSPRTVTAGEVEVRIVPVRIDDSGAIFRVSLDTHSGELALDLAGASQLEVNGSSWSGATWTGDAPGGHHVLGELSFPAGGPATGEARLTIGGLPAPVVATWTLAGQG